MKMGGYIATGLSLLALPSFLFAQDPSLSPTPTASPSSALPTYSTFVFINEFLPDPVGSDTENEFIELYNESDTEADISGWVLDTGGSSTFSFSSGTVIAPHGFLVFLSGDTGAKISLTNTGDTIVLAWPDGTTQDEVTYVGSSEGWSYNRTNEGAYEQSALVTPGAKNDFPPAATPIPTGSPSPEPSFTPSPTPTVAVYSDEVSISEFLPNPVGDDTIEEFIELHNASSDTADISEWILDTGGGSVFEIPDGTSIPGGGYMALYRGTTKLVLNNAGDRTVRLRDPLGTVHANAAYAGSKEGYSYNRMDDGTYRQSSKPTPNAANIIVEEPTPSPKGSPSPVVSAQADEDESDGDTAAAYDFSSDVIIFEILPNPIGTDAHREFIELKNAGATTVRLAGWTLDDGEKGSAPYRFTEEDVLGPGGISVFFRTQTNIALNNDADEVRLIDPSKKIISSIGYAAPVPEGQSYARSADGAFVWTEDVTPGDENTIHVQSEEDRDPPVSARAGSVASSRSIAARPALARANGLLPSPLPWPQINEGVVSRSVIGMRERGRSGRQGAFIVVGGLAAFVQLIGGVAHKEKIWYKS